MDQFAETLDKIGSFGKYQVFICGLLAFSTVPNGFLVMAPVFTQNTPQHYCRIPQLEKLATQQDFSLPLEKNKEGVFAKSQCKRIHKSNCYRYSDIGFTWNGTSAIPMHTNNSNRVILDCNHGWVYEGDRTTLATEWDIVCDDAWLLPLTTTLYMIGFLIGSFISGIFSDRYGRRPTFLLGTVAMYACIGLNSFSVNIYMYMATFFGCGVTALINYMAAFVLASEIIHVSKRSLIGSLETTGFSVGYMVLVPAAYLITDWQWLVRIQVIFGVIFIPYYWWLPESPLWLMCSGKVEEAMVIMRKIAKINGKTICTLLQKSDEKEKPQEKAVQKFTYLDMLKHSSIRKRSLVMFYIWFMVSMVYYCISLNTSNLGGNKFINCFVAAAVEIPSYVLSCFSLELVGRRCVLSLFLCISAITLGISPFLKAVSETLMIAGAMTSKFFISACFNISYLFCGELFPTLMRNMSIGASSTAARVGSIASPYLIFLGQQTNFYSPYLIMASFGLSAAGLCLLLPETKSIPLPETMEDAEELERFESKMLKSNKFQSTYMDIEPVVL
uniref:Major facilitator superfamily (MFS) profile domain-containing protein n=1 Tax=Ciona intestinalis TaxID=7719 RepID=F6WIM7_CIOIN